MWKSPVAILVYAYVAVMFLLAVVKLLHGKTESAISFALMGVVVALLIGSVLYVYESMNRREQAAIEAAGKAPAAAVQPAKPVTPPDRPIEMRPASGSFAEEFIISLGFLMACIGLLIFPDVLWTRWLSYPVALVLLIVSGASFSSTWAVRNKTIAADRSGLEIRVKGKIVEKIAWTDIGMVMTLKIEHRKSNSAIATSTSRYLVMENRGGEEIFRIDEPLTPPEAYVLFLECIPSWTGLKVRRELRSGSNPPREE